MDPKTYQKLAAENKLTPELRVKKELCLLAAQKGGIFTHPISLETEEEICKTYKEFDSSYDPMKIHGEFCRGQVVTGIQSTYSSLYFQPISVARKTSDGTWIGWTYWTAQNTPEICRMVLDPYELEYNEETKTFTKKES